MDAKPLTNGLAGKAAACRRSVRWPGNLTPTRFAGPIERGCRCCEAGVLLTDPVDILGPGCPGATF
jgi:hypothetical protein